MLTRGACRALGIQPSASDLASILESLDPTSVGFIPYDPFLGLAAIYIQDRSGGSDSGISSPPADLSDEEEEYVARTSTAKSKAKAKARSKGKGKRKNNIAMVVDEEEVIAAYQLFTKGGTGPITIAHLRKIAKELREDVSDDVLRDMIVEANGEGGASGARDGWKKGVGIEDFENVMKRAGVFG